MGSCNSVVFGSDVFVSFVFVFPALRYFWSVTVLHVYILPWHSAHLSLWVGRGRGDLWAVRFVVVTCTLKVLMSNLVICSFKPLHIASALAVRSVVMFH